MPKGQIFTIPVTPRQRFAITGILLGINGQDMAPKAKGVEEVTCRSRFRQAFDLKPLITTLTTEKKLNGKWLVDAPAELFNLTDENTKELTKIIDAVPIWDNDGAISDLLESIVLAKEEGYTPPPLTAHDSDKEEPWQRSEEEPKYSSPETAAKLVDLTSTLNDVLQSALVENNQTAADTLVAVKETINQMIVALKQKLQIS